MSSIITTKISSKDIFGRIENYLGKERLQKLTKDFNALLIKMYDKNAKKYKIEGLSEIKDVISKEVLQPRQGGRWTPFPQNPLVSSIYNRKGATKNPDDVNDIAKVLLSFLLGTREGVMVTGSQIDLSFSAKKKLLWQFVDSEFFKELTRLPKVNVKKEWEGLKKTIKAIDERKRKTIALASLGATLAIGMALMGFQDQENFTGLKPEVIVGTVPLFSVQMVERARSDRKLKNRAIGDIFLAHQKGNKDVLRLDATLSGPLRFIYLAFFVQLQKEGEAKQGNITLKPGAIVTIPSAGTGSGELTKRKVLNYDVHNTFPIITRTAIMFNMYLQTIEWHQSVQDGKGVVKVHLLFRKYFPTTAFKVLEPIWDEEEKVAVGGKSIEVGEDFGMAKRWMEFTVDAIWKMMKVYGETHGRMLIGDDGSETHIIDQQAVSSMEKLVTSYSGKFLGII